MGRCVRYIVPFSGRETQQAPNAATAFSMAKWLRRPTVNRKIPSSTLGGEVSFFAGIILFCGRCSDCSDLGGQISGWRSPSCQTRQWLLTAGIARDPTSGREVPYGPDMFRSSSQNNMEPNLDSLRTRNHHHRLEYHLLFTNKTNTESHTVQTQHV